MKQDRVIGGYRTILSDGVTIKKVLLNVSKQIFTIQETCEIIPHGKVCKKSSLIKLENGKWKIKKRPKSRYYDDWWQESNLDGSFAYNGVTDDF